MIQDEFNRGKVIQDNETKVVCAQISASKAEAKSEPAIPGSEPVEPDTNSALVEAVKALTDAFSRPKTLIRGPDGKAIGIQ
jgi:hypothetical protein